MKLTIIESPYAGDIKTNLSYARAAVKDALARGEAAFGSHLIYTQTGILDDGKAKERKLGIDAGFAWGRKADIRAFYTDLGVSSGMLAGLEQALQLGQHVEIRSLKDWYTGKLAGSIVNAARFADTLRHIKTVTVQDQSKRWVGSAADVLSHLGAK